MQFQRATQQQVLIPQELIIFNENNQTFDCREDEAAMQFAALVVTESIAKPFSLIGEGAFAWFLKGKILKKKDWKVEIRESEEIVWILYY